MLLEEHDGNKDEWKEEPPLLEPGCQQMWNGKGCSPDTLQQILNPEKPNAARFIESEADKNPITEGTSPSSVDTITSHDSLNLILPSDAMKLQSKKSVNVSLSSAASPDFHTTSTSSHLVSSTQGHELPSLVSSTQGHELPSHQPKSHSLASAPPPSVNIVPTPTSPPQISRPLLVPVFPTLPTNTWQYSPASQFPASTPRSTVSKSQLPQPVPSSSQRFPPATRQIVTLPSRSLRKPMKFKKVRGKRIKERCRPSCQSCQRSKPTEPKKKLICKESKVERRTKKPTFKRDTYVMKNKQKTEEARTIRSCGCSKRSDKTKRSKTCTVSTRTPKKETRKRKDGSLC